jgi:REP element-mobilizing transposase RayT
MEKPRRKSIRLKEYDYSTPGYYFVTICIHDRRCLFGEISDKGMVMNDAGRMVERWFREIDNKYLYVEIDEYTVMPNHFHGIIQIVGADLCVRPETPCSSEPDLENHTNINKNKKQGRHAGLPLQDIYNHPSIPEIVQWFKTMTTNDYIKGVKQNNWQPFNDKLWQRNYYEHVIRNEIDLSEIKEYIVNNQKKWHLDKYNLENRETQRIQNV